MAITINTSCYVDAELWLCVYMHQIWQAITFITRALWSTYPVRMHAALQLHAAREYEHV